MRTYEVRFVHAHYVRARRRPSPQRSVRVFDSPAHAREVFSREGHEVVSVRALGAEFDGPSDQVEREDGARGRGRPRPRPRPKESHR
jgi:hypothetical protein